MDHLLEELQMAVSSMTAEYNRSLTVLASLKTRYQTEMHTSIGKQVVADIDAAGSALQLARQHIQRMRRLAKDVK